MPDTMLCMPSGRLLRRPLAGFCAGVDTPFNMAIIHAGLGDADAAFASLETAFTDRSRSMAWLNVTRELDALRQDPRFEGFLDRIGLTHQ